MRIVEKSELKNEKPCTENISKIIHIKTLSVTHKQTKHKPKLKKRSKFVGSSVTIDKLKGGYHHHNN